MQHTQTSRDQASARCMCHASPTLSNSLTCACFDVEDSRPVIVQHLATASAAE